MARQFNIRPQITPEDLDRYENLLREAWDKPWWREYIRKTEEQLNDMLGQLVNSHLDQRQEDRLRGKIDAFSWPLALDDEAARLNDPQLQEKLRSRRTQNGR